MDWCFIDNNILEETNTGYTIQLMSGTWFHPKDIKPVAPRDMSFLQQAQLLRCGLDYVVDLCHGKEANAM